MRLRSRESFTPPSCWWRSCVVLGRSPEAARAPTSRRSRAFSAILQLAQGSCTEGAERIGWDHVCCYESSPRGRAPPLRIPDRIVLVTTSSCGRCWVLQRIKRCDKQLWCSLILPTRITGKQLSHAPSGMALDICMPRVLPSFNLFIFH